MTLDIIRNLANTVDADDIELITDVLTAAQEYVTVVTQMGIMQMNLEGETGEEQRNRIQTIDKKRSVIHNKFIDSVNIANRLATSLNVAPIYEGGPERREYGDFAFAIVDELFKTRA